MKIKQIISPLTLSACVIALILSGCNNSSNSNSSNKPTHHTSLNFHTDGAVSLTNGVAPVSARQSTTSTTACDEKDARDDLVCKTVYINYSGDNAPQLKISNHADDFQLKYIDKCLSAPRGDSPKVFNCKKYQLFYIPKDKSEISTPIKTQLVANVGDDTTSLDILAQVPVRFFYEKTQPNYFFDYVDRLDSATTPFNITSTAPDGYEFSNQTPSKVRVIPAGFITRNSHNEKSIDMNDANIHFGNYFSPANDNINSYFTNKSHQEIQSIRYTSNYDIPASDTGTEYAPYKIILTRDFIVATDQGNVYSLATMSNKPNTESLKNLANHVPGSNLNPVIKQKRIYDLSLYNDGCYGDKSTEYHGYVMYKDKNGIPTLGNNLEDMENAGIKHQIGTKTTKIIDSSKVDDDLFNHFNFYLTNDNANYSLWIYYPYNGNNQRNIYKLKFTTPPKKNPMLTAFSNQPSFYQLSMAIYNADHSINFYDIDYHAMTATYRTSLPNVYQQQPVKFSWHSYNDSYTNQGEKPLTKVFMVGVSNSNDLTFIDPSQSGKTFSIPAADFSDNDNNLTNFEPKTFACADEDMNDFPSLSTKNSIAPTCYMAGWDKSIKRIKVYKINGFDPNKITQLKSMKITVASTLIASDSSISDTIEQSTMIIDGDTAALAVLPNTDSDRIYHYQISDDTPKATSFAYNPAIQIKTPIDGEKFVGLYLH